MVKFFKKLLSRNKYYINITMQELDDMRKKGEITIIDVRSPLEYGEGNINGSINIPLYELNNKIELIKEDKNCPIVVYCSCGQRSKKAAMKLVNKGYTNIYNLKEGIQN